VRNTWERTCHGEPGRVSTIGSYISTSHLLFYTCPTYHFHTKEAQAHGDLARCKPGSLK